MSRWISCVRPPGPRRSRSMRSRRAARQHAVLGRHPAACPCPRRNGGTLSWTVAVQMTRVAPISISTEPSAGGQEARHRAATGRSSAGAPAVDRRRDARRSTIARIDRADIAPRHAPCARRIARAVSTAATCDARRHAVTRGDDMHVGERATITRRQRRRLPSLIGEHPLIQKIGQLIRRSRRPTRPILIMGESGTGKELVARAIHAPEPARRSAVHPGQLRRHPGRAARVRDVRPRARRLHRAPSASAPGMFQLANGGTIFLDEVGRDEPARCR